MLPMQGVAPNPALGSVHGCSRICDFTHALKFSPHQCSGKQEYFHKGRKWIELGGKSMMAPLCHSMSLGFLLEEKITESAKIIVTWRNET